MLNLDADEQEINLADDDILQMVPFELHSQWVIQAKCERRAEYYCIMGKDGL